MNVAARFDVKLRSLREGSKKKAVLLGKLRHPGPSMRCFEPREPTLPLFTVSSISID